MKVSHGSGFSTVTLRAVACFPRLGEDLSAAAQITQRVMFAVGWDGDGARILNVNLQLSFKHSICKNLKNSSL